MIRYIAAAIFAMILAREASAQVSTINPALPANGLPYSASVIRGQFDNAYNDINALAVGPLVNLLGITITPHTGVNTGINVFQIGSGIASGTSTCDSTIGTGFAFNCFKISSDTSVGSAGGVNAQLVLNYSFGGNSDTDRCVGVNLQCSHTPLWIDLTQTAPTVGVGFNTSLFVNNIVNSGAPGYLQSGTTPVQSIYGLGVQVSDGGGLHYGVTGGEVDIALAVNNTQRKMGWEVASAPLLVNGVLTKDEFQGTLFSSAYDAFTSGAGPCAGPGAGPGGSSCAGFSTGFSFGRDDAYVPVTSTGTLMKVTAGIGTATFANGVDFSAATFSGCSFKSMGSCINQLGNYANASVFPATYWNDTTLTPTTGGYVRLASLGVLNPVGTWQFQINTAVAADFSTVTVPLQLSSVGLEIPKIFPAFLMNDLSATPTTGGLIRLAGIGSGAYSFQINTAVGADFGTVITPLAWGATGGVSMTALPTSAGGGGLYVCVDTAGVLYKKATCP